MWTLRHQLRVFVWKIEIYSLTWNVVIIISLLLTRGKVVLDLFSPLQEHVYLIILSVLKRNSSRLQFSLALPLEALGIQDDNIIFDGQLTSSSAAVGHEAWRGRLHGQDSWKPEVKEPPPNFKVKFYSPVNITYIATQGSPDQDCWATSFRLQYRVQNGSLTDYQQVCQLWVYKSLPRDCQWFLIDEVGS